MENIYIYHHLGLGDHIICNGLIRNVCKKIHNVNLFVKPQYYDSVQFMYRDISNLKLIKADDSQVHDFLKDIPGDEQLIVTTGKRTDMSKKFDEVFYNCTGLNFNRRWDDFYFLRDSVREDALYNELVMTEDYAFIHDDNDRNFNIDDSGVSSDLQIVRPSKDATSNIFDYTRIIENAKEIHVIDSCFKHIIESIDTKAEKMFYYTSIRGRGVDNMSNSRKKWIEL
jgi:hypothetical protein